MNVREHAPAEPRSALERTAAERTAAEQSAAAQTAAEEALRDRISRLENIIDASGMGTFEWNVQLDRIVCDERYAEILGYSLAELQPFNAAAWTALAHPEDVPACRRELERHFAGEVDQYDCECRMRHKDGSWVWVVARGRLSSRTADGKPLMMLGTQYDINARKQAEAAARLAQQQRELAQQRRDELVATVDGIVWEADAQTFRFNFVSAQAERLLGHPIARWLDEPTFWVDHIHPEDRHGAVQYCVSCTRELRDHRFDYRMRAADGRYVWLQDVVTVVAKDGRPTELRGIMMDITARKQAEEALRESEKRLRLAVQASNVGLWDWELGTNRVSYSREWKAQLGYAEHEIANEFSEWERRVHPDDLPAAMEKVQRYLAKPEGPHEVEFRMRHKNGSWRWIYVRAEVVREEEGRPLRFLGCHVDVTERRQLEERLQHAQRMEAIGQLAGGVAHDFNNLLTVIQGSAAMLREDAGGAAASPNDTLSELMRAAERATALTRQLLTFSRRQRLEARPLDLNAVVGNLFSMLQRLIGEDVRLGLELDREALVIVADPGLLEQVLVNLAVNARDAMPDGGRLLVATSRQRLEAGDLQHPEAKPGPHARLRVIDSGAGIAAEHLPHIFEPFFTTKDVGKGTGLGLATVFGIVQQHGGWVQVASEPSRGTRFDIFFPLVARTQQDGAGVATRRPAGAERADVASQRGTESILLVEDEEPVRRLVERVLARAGYRVLTAASGNEALQVLAEPGLQVDLVLTDLIMPGGVSGQELGRRLREHDAQVRILYMSGYTGSGGSSDVPDRYRLPEGSRLLTKPFTPATLLEHVRVCLSGDLLATPSERR